MGKLARRGACSSFVKDNEKGVVLLGTSCRSSLRASACAVPWAMVLVLVCVVCVVCVECVLFLKRAGGGKRTKKRRSAAAESWKEELGEAGAACGWAGLQAARGRKEPLGPHHQRTTLPPIPLRWMRARPEKATTRIDGDFCLVVSCGWPKPFSIFCLLLHSCISA